jgi:hypothetical protein
VVYEEMSLKVKVEKISFKSKRHLLEDVSCLIFKLWLFGVFKRRYFKFLLYTKKGKSMTPGAGPILIPGHIFEQTW